MAENSADTAALRQAAQAARDAAAAQRWDDLAARLHYEGDQVSSDPTRLRYAELLWHMAGQLQGAAEGLRALAAGERAEDGRWPVITETE